MLTDWDSAAKLARQLIIDFPKSSRPWAIICRSAPDSVRTTELEAEVPQHAMLDEEVPVALAMRALRHADWLTAERLASPVAKRGSQWPAPWLMLAQSRLQLAVQTGFKLVGGSLLTQPPNAMTDILGLFDRAVELAEAEQNKFFLVQSLMERARAKRLTFDLHGADDDCARAYSVAPGDPEILYRYGYHLFQRGRPGAAIPLLRQAIGLGRECDAKFMLAMSLYEHDRAGNYSEWVALAMQAAGDREAFYRWDAISIALDGLLEQKQVSEANDFLERIRETLPAIAVDACAVRIELTRGDREAAAKRAATALTGVANEKNTKVVALVAEAIALLDDHVNALPLWERIADETRCLPDVWRLVSTAKRAGRFDVVRQVCRKWREAGAVDSRLLHDELEILVRFAPQEALALLEQEVMRRPDDRLLRLRLSCLAIQLDRRDLVVRDPQAYPLPDQVGAHNGVVVAWLFREIEAHDAALRYSYSLLRHNQDDPDAHGVLAAVVLSGGAKDLLDPPEEADVGSAVCFSEDGAEQQQWRVIEDEPEGPRFPDDLPPEHGLAVRLKGLHPGDNFIISGDEIDGRKATVRALVSKYVYRANRCMSEWQIHFPDQPGFEMFHMSMDTDRNIPDLTPIIRRTHKRQRNLQELFKLYAEQPLSIHSLAKAAGSHFADTMHHLATSGENAIRCCDSNPSEFENAVTVATAASAIVIDLSAILTLFFLELDERLADWPSPLVISSATLRKLRTFRDSRQEHPSGWILPANTDIGIRFVERSEEDNRREYERLVLLVEHITAAAECRDCGGLADLPPEERDNAINYCGQHGAECVLLARTAGHGLWTDDFGVAAFGQHAFSIRRTWTQAVLARLTSEGFLSAEEYWKASAKLVGFSYNSTRFDAATVQAAAELAGWRSRVWPLKQTLQAFAKPHDPERAMLIAVQFIFTISNRAIVLQDHYKVVMALLDAVAANSLGIMRVLRTATSHEAGANAQCVGRS